MRWLSRWLPAVLGVVLSVAPAWALPQPKLPPESEDKPSLVVRVRPIQELLKDAGYVAKLVGQEEIFGAIEPGLAPILEAIDGKKPIGFYARIRPAGIDSQGVLLLPIKSEKAFLGVLAQFGITPTQGQDGLNSVNVPGSPFLTIFRFANGYVYATVKNTPDAEAALNPAKMYRPESLFAADDASMISVTLNADAIPNALRLKALAGLEDGLRKVRENELPKEKNPIVRQFAETAAEEVAMKVQSLIVDAQTAIWRFDLDRAKEEMSLSFRLTARKGTELANDISTVGTGTGLGAGLAKDPSAAQGAVSIVVPTAMKKALAPVVDEFLDKAWRSAPANKQQDAKTLLEALGPTMKSGLLDGGFDLRGPGASNFVSLLAGFRVQDGDRVEEAIRKLYANLSPDEKRDVTLDIAKADGITIHGVTPKLDDNAKNMFGPQAKAYFAFRKDLALLAIGPESEALPVLKDGLSANPTATKVVQGQVSMRNLAKLLEAKEPRVGEAARKAFPDSVRDTIRFEVSGGAALEARFSASSRLIQFGVLAEQARRR